MPSVALVVLDTLRSDTFDDHFDWLPGRQFSRAYSTSHWTVPTHASLFTGAYASEVGVHGHAGDLDCAGAGPRRGARRGGLPNPLSHREPTAVPVRRLGPRVRRVRRPRQPARLRGRRLRLGRVFRRPRFDRRPAVPRGHLALCPLRTARRASRSDRGTNCTRVRRPTAAQRRSATGFGLPISVTRSSCSSTRMETHTPYHPARPDDDPSRYSPPTPSPTRETDLQSARRAYERSAAYLSDRYREIFADLSEDFDYVVTLSTTANCSASTGW